MKEIRSRQGYGEKSTQNFDWKPKQKRPLRRFGCIYIYIYGRIIIILKYILQKTECQGVDWINVAQDMTQ
jgi:hypothetical protein